MGLEEPVGEGRTLDTLRHARDGPEHAPCSAPSSRGAALRFVPLSQCSATQRHMRVFDAPHLFSRATSASGGDSVRGPSEPGSAASGRQRSVPYRRCAREAMVRPREGEQRPAPPAPRRSQYRQLRGARRSARERAGVPLRRRAAARLSPALGCLLLLGGARTRPQPVPPASPRSAALPRARAASAALGHSAALPANGKCGWPSMAAAPHQTSSWAAESWLPERGERGRDGATATTRGRGMLRRLRLACPTSGRRTGARRRPRSRSGGGAMAFPAPSSAARCTRARPAGGSRLLQSPRALASSRDTKNAGAEGAGAAFVPKEGEPADPSDPTHGRPRVAGTQPCWSVTRVCCRFIAAQPLMDPASGA